jgi:hypothetical protein
MAMVAVGWSHFALSTPLKMRRLATACTAAWGSWNISASESRDRES